MSIWADIYRRSIGVQKRKEDEITAWSDDIWPQMAKIYSKIISSNVVSVQPMSEPTGKLFYFDP